mmetsp:Transcript_26570/g.59021  ORF Transcript_26570/g.59021 Transcript_26570/m.59021 type:complete len:726 (-) Transcript_26570:254-2431(-)
MICGKTSWQQLQPRKVHVRVAVMLVSLVISRTLAAASYQSTIISTACRKACHFTCGETRFRIVSTPSSSSSSVLGIGAIRRSTPKMMPEGPEVRTLVDQLQPAVGMRLIELRFLSGRYVRHGRPKGFDEFRKTMTPLDRSAIARKVCDSGENDEGDINEEDMLAQALATTSNQEIDIVTEWNAKGKFMYMILDDGNPDAVTGEAGGLDNNDYLRSIWITLGMSGRFVSEAADSAENYMHNYSNNSIDDSARWFLDFYDPDSERTRRIYYHDTRNFGTMRFSLSETELMKKLASLGMDILDEKTTGDGFVAMMDKTKPSMNICKFLMDQKKVSGIGNYILAEGLHRANIDPFACLSELSEQQKRTLFDELQATAQLSYASQGLTRTKGGSYRTPDGERGRFEFNLQCYGQEICPRGRPVLRETDGPHGRTIWYVEDQLFVPRSKRDLNGQIMDTYSTSASAPKPKPKRKRGAMATGKSVSSLLNDESISVPMSPNAGNLADGIEDSGWKEALEGCTSSASFEQLSQFVKSERESGIAVYPPEDEVFSALNLCPLDSVKVVICGQDPYFGPNQGHGMAFSVKPGVRPPPSLQNIYKEVIEDVGIEPPQHGFLKSWAEQGVLLLNSVLTVRRGEANSHAGRGWEDFTDEVINVLNEQKEGLVFLLWGGPAQKKASGVDASKHTIIKTSHPSPLGATKTSSPFLGSKCFSRANAALIEAGKDPIDWNVR